MCRTTALVLEAGVLMGLELACREHALLLVEPARLFVRAAAKRAAFGRDHLALMNQESLERRMVPRQASPTQNEPTTEGMTDPTSSG